MRLLRVEVFNIKSEFLDSESDSLIAISKCSRRLLAGSSYLALTAVPTRLTILLETAWTHSHSIVREAGWHSRPGPDE